jgi:hypothetical protein
MLGCLRYLSSLISLTAYRGKPSFSCGDGQRTGAREGEEEVREAGEAGALEEYSRGTKEALDAC